METTKKDIQKHALLLHVSEHHSMTNNFMNSIFQDQSHQTETQVIHLHLLNGKDIFEALLGISSTWWVHVHFLLNVITP